MLAMTAAAADAIQDLLVDQPEGAGLRVSLEKPGNGTEPEFALCVVEAPHAADDVVEVHGARLFIEPAASGYFADKVLDSDGDTFTFGPA
ncbi:MAG: Fe-S cluster assembly protein HesB [Actinobacteria bacterium]|nr:MAG: Fe-S cluster assembly protein HesB [Actinomycetota bacterium]